MKLFNLNLTFKHDRDYYWGLFLLVLSCLSLVWALWRDSFTPQVFLAGLLAFSWGYAFLWRHDLHVRMREMQVELDELRARVMEMGDTAEAAVWAQELHEVELVEMGGGVSPAGDEQEPGEEPMPAAEDLLPDS